MAIDKQQIIDEFKLKPFGSKNWYRSNQLTCLECGQNDEFAVLFTSDGGIVRCLHSRSCNNYSTSLSNYLRLIGKTDLVEFEQSVNIAEFPSFSSISEQIEENLILSTKTLPIGFKRIDFDSYLDGRNFLPEHYELFRVGETKLHPKFRDYNIFQFLNEKEECVAWMARSKKDKKWHDENLRKYKLGLCDLRLRYDNSPDTNFSKILGGYNEINENTHTIILVEGIMDKTNVDKQLGLLYEDEIKCNFTFGNSVDLEQIALISRLEHIKNVLLLYDGGTIKNSKISGLNLANQLKNKKVRIGMIEDKKLDPGAMTAHQIINTLEQSVNAFEFNVNKINGFV